MKSKHLIGLTGGSKLKYNYKIGYLAAENEVLF